jgi:hypothetical protein
VTSAIWTSNTTWSAVEKRRRPAVRSSQPAAVRNVPISSQAYEAKSASGRFAFFFGRRCSSFMGVSLSQQ